MSGERSNVEAARPLVVKSFVRRFRNEILAEWRRAARELPAAKALDPVSLVDHIPELLDEIAELAEQLGADRTPSTQLDTARNHALDRIGNGFDIVTLVRELSVLRGAALAVWGRSHAAGNLAELRALDLAIDGAIAVSVGRYAEEHERGGSRLLEHELERAAAERERALAKLDALLSAAPVGIAFVDHELRYLRINDALAELNGRPADEHIGRTVAEVLPEVAPRLVPRLREVLETGIPALDLELTRGPRALLASYFPIRSPAGETLGVGGIVFDVTEQKRAEEELRIAVRTREDVLSVVSHDLRGPLGTVQLSATLLMSQHGADPRSRRHLELIQRACRRMENLIDDLLDTASIRAGRLQLEIRREAVDAIVGEALDLHAPIAEEKDVRLVRACDVRGVDVLCDRDRILQVFGNLIGNAIKFCRAGGAITVTGERRGDDVVFSVADTGPGIRPDMLPYVFDPYWSGSEYTKRGSGLGLYISRGIVEGHGGRIWVESAPGAGASFLFTLPIAA